jgi:small subunit ribosomal protein S20
MAHHKSAKKRIRRNDRRSDINGTRVGRIRTFIKAVETAVESGDKAAASEAFKVAEPEMMRGVSRGVFAKNTMSRKVSRLSARVKAMA